MCRDIKSASNGKEKCMLALCQTKCYLIKHSAIQRIATKTDNVSHANTQTHFFFCFRTEILGSNRWEKINEGLNSSFFLLIPPVMFTRGSFDRCMHIHTYTQ